MSRVRMRRARYRDPVWGRRGARDRLAVALLLICTLTACIGPTLPGSAIAAERAEVGAGVQIVADTVPSTIRPTDDQLLAAIFGDLNTYWTSVLTNDFRQDMSALRGGYQSIDSSASSLAPGRKSLCHVTPADMVGNAFYCPSSDGVVVDNGVLVPVVLSRYGIGGLTAALAHEFGHAVQIRIGPTDADRAAQSSDYPSLIIENGGDCNSGAFLAWVTSGSAPHLQLDSAALLRAVGPLLDFRDPVDVPASDGTAHGLSLDRLRAFLVGYRSGPTACRALKKGWNIPTLGHAGVTTEEGPPRFAAESEVQNAAEQSLRALPGDYPAVPATPADAAAGDLASARPIGQYAVAAAVAFAQWRSAGLTPSAASCSTGAWTGSVFGHTASGALGNWAGDADEALDFIRGRSGATFTDVEAFATGFDQGPTGCARYRT